MIHTSPDLCASAIAQASHQAVRAIPPLWPLASSVAVNPYLGQSGLDLAKTGVTLARVAGAAVVMPRPWYAEKIRSRRISDQDLLEAWRPSGLELGPDPVEALKRAAHQARDRPEALPTMAHLASKVSGLDWPGFVAERIGAWAGGYFDEGQALWATPRGGGAYTTWRASAIHDLTPEIVGLRGFAQFVSQTPDNAEAAIDRAAERLGLSVEALETYFHRLLLDLGGWAQYARHLLWREELAGRKDAAALDLLAVRLVWEEALFEQYRERIDPDWRQTISAYAEPAAPDRDMIIDTILQSAAERAAQRDLTQTLAAPSLPACSARPILHAAFCIDVRSEVFRRALESLDPGIRTSGFAGFFGLPVAYRRFASDVEEPRLPVLLKPSLCASAGGPETAAADGAARIDARGKRAWGRFKLAAVSAFAFVEGAGALYAGKLVRDGLALASKRAPAEPAPKFDPALSLEDRIKAAEAVLKAMSLTDGFAPLVMLVGHSAQVVNNPHANALHCGACGGYSGEVNARLLAALLNDPDVKSGLASSGIHIPPDTLFVAGLHNTTTDEITIYSADHPSAAHQPVLKQARHWCAAAGVWARAERSLRLGDTKGGSATFRRSRDWSEVRPEWALAGCSALIAAPRARTVGKDFAGRAFLHDYDWRTDADFSVLKLILTAPVVVASWISLQYYGSTVSPEVFGAGNKLIHNVVGGIGVIEGNGGRLRGGLPWQSVYDGERLVHEPLRLSVCIEAPCDAMSGVLARHTEVRALFDNGWLNLFALNDLGEIAQRYAGGLKWVLEGAVSYDNLDPEPPR